MLTQTAIRLLLLSALCAGPPALYAANVLLITQTGGSLTAGESARKTQFEAWGHVVTTLGDSSSQASYDAAMASVDVVYIPMTVQEWEISTKAKGTTKGVVCEERYLDIEMGFSSADGWNANHNQTEVLSNSHAVTTGLSTGYVTVTNSGQELAIMNPTLAGGMTVLSKQNYSAGNMLGVMEQGAALAGGGTAAGRRVRLPWGGDNFNWSSLNANGQKIAQQAIAWAAVGGEQLLLHWKLDETSGTNAADASTFGRTGSVTGTASWVAGRRDGAIDLNGTTKVEITSLLGEPTSFTIAGWAKLDAADSGGAELVSVGDYFALRIDGNSSTQCRAFFRHSSGWTSVAAPWVAAEQGWHHYAATFDDSSNTFKLYIDGVLVATASTANTLSYSGLGSKTIVGGHGNGGASFDFDGAIDDVRIYNYPLPPEKIAEVYGLIAHWKLDEPSGATANDSSLAANHATLTGSQNWTTGKDAGAHGFVYTNGEDYFTAPTNSGLDDVQEGDYTVMAYFKPNSLPPGSGSANDAAYAIVSKQGYHLGLLYDNAGNFLHEHWLSSVTWVGAGSWSVGPYPPGQFYHVAGVVSRTNGTVKLYVNGALIDTGTFTPGAAAREYGSSRWRLGVSSPGGGSWGRPADGVIDDARIYNRALSDEEIAEYATTGLLAHWRFDETTGTAVADSSGKGNHAEFATGSPSWSSAVRTNGIALNGASTVATSDPFAPPQAGSVAFWFRHNGLTAGNQRLFGLSDTWEARLSSGGLLTFDIGSGDGPTFAEAFIDSDRWRHVVIRYQANGAYSIFLDGQFHASGTSSSPSATAATLTFGTRTGSAQHFAGAMDDIRVYSYELSAQEIAEVYGLVGRWKLDESSGAVAVDSSGMGRHGTIFGSPSQDHSGPKPPLRATLFDGVDDAVALPVIEDDFQEGISIACWANTIGSPNYAKFMQLSQGQSMEVSLGRRLATTDLHGVATVGGQMSSTGSIVSGNWRHYAMTIDPTGWMKLYRDGILLVEAQRSLPLIGTRSTNSIGDSQWPSDDLYSGLMHDVRLYNRAITPAEVRALYYGQFSPGVRIISWQEVQ